MKRRAIETVGDLRTVVTNAIQAVLHGDMKATDGAVIIKGGEVITAALYSEAKIAALAAAAGKIPHEIGALPIGTPDEGKKGKP